MSLADFYGPKSQILNAHHLIHVNDDVESISNKLSDITAFTRRRLFWETLLD